MSLMSHQRPFYEGKKGIKERDVILAQFVANFLGIYKIRSEYDSGNLISDATSLIYEVSQLKSLNGRIINLLFSRSMVLFNGILRPKTFVRLRCMPKK